jgi:hypothetical protein
MSMRSLSSAEWPILARFALMGIEILLVKESLIRGHYEWRDTLASIGMRLGNYTTDVLLAGVAAYALLAARFWPDFIPRPDGADRSRLMLVNLLAGGVAGALFAFVMLMLLGGRPGLTDAESPLAATIANSGWMDITSVSVLRILSAIAASL